MGATRSAKRRSAAPQRMACAMWISIGLQSVQNVPPAKLYFCGCTPSHSDSISTILMHAFNTGRREWASDCVPGSFGNNNVCEPQKWVDQYWPGRPGAKADYWPTLSYWARLEFWKQLSEANHGPALCFRSFTPLFAPLCHPPQPLFFHLTGLVGFAHWTSSISIRVFCCVVQIWCEAPGRSCRRRSLRH